MRVLITIRVHVHGITGLYHAKETGTNTFFQVAALFAKQGRYTQLVGLSN